MQANAEAYFAQTDRLTQIDTTAITLSRMHRGLTTLFYSSWRLERVQGREKTKVRASQTSSGN